VLVCLYLQFMVLSLGLFVEKVNKKEMKLQRCCVVFWKFSFIIRLVLSKVLGFSSTLIRGNSNSNSSRVWKITTATSYQPREIKELYHFVLFWGIRRKAYSWSDAPTILRESVALSFIYLIIKWLISFYFRI